MNLINIRFTTCSFFSFFEIFAKKKIQTVMLAIHLYFFSSDILLSSPYFHQYSSDAPHQCSLLRKLLDFTLTTLVIYYHVRGKIMKIMLRPESIQHISRQSFSTSTALIIITTGNIGSTRPHMAQHPIGWKQTLICH